MYYHDGGADESGRCGGAPGLRGSCWELIGGGSDHLKGMTESWYGKLYKKSMEFASEGDVF